MGDLTKRNGDVIAVDGLRQGKVIAGQGVWGIVAEKLNRYECTGLTPDEVVRVRDLSLVQKDVIVQTEDDREYMDFCCPHCRNTLQQAYKAAREIVIHEFKYCPDCGQRLSWKEIKI